MKAMTSTRHDSATLTTKRRDNEASVVTRRCRCILGASCQRWQLSSHYE